MTNRYKEALGRSSFGTQEVRQMQAEVSNKQTTKMARKLAENVLLPDKRGNIHGSPLRLSNGAKLPLGPVTTRG